MQVNQLYIIGGDGTHRGALRIASECMQRVRERERESEGGEGRAREEGGEGEKAFILFYFVFFSRRSQDRMVFTVACIKHLRWIRVVAANPSRGSSFNASWWRCRL